MWQTLFALHLNSEKVGNSPESVQVFFLIELDSSNLKDSYIVICMFRFIIIIIIFRFRGKVKGWNLMFYDMYHYNSYATCSGTVYTTALCFVHPDWTSTLRALFKEIIYLIKISSFEKLGSWCSLSVLFLLQFY